MEIGFSELLLTALVALLVLGPERLPRAARMAGLWVRRARATWYSVRAQLERELADDEMKRSIAAVREPIAGLRDDLGRSIDTPRPATGETTPATPRRADDAAAPRDGDAAPGRADDEAAR